MNTERDTLMTSQNQGSQENHVIFADVGNLVQYSNASS